MTSLQAEIARLTKDLSQKIQELQAELEAQRARLETRINELDLIIKRYTESTLQLDAQVLDLQN